MEINSMKTELKTHNNFIDKYNLSQLTEKEQNILMIIVAITQKQKEYTRFHAKELKDLVDKTMSYKKLGNTLKELCNKRLKLIADKDIYNSDGSIAVESGEVRFPIIFTELILHNDKTISLKFNPDIKYIFFCPENKYFLFCLHYYLKLTSYSKNLYSILKRWENYKNNLILKIEQLEMSIGLEDKKYRYHDIKRRVLERGMIEINKTTDIEIEYKEIKDGKEVSKIEFIIRNKKDSIKEAFSEIKGAKQLSIYDKRCMSLAEKFNK